MCRSIRGVRHNAAPGNKKQENCAENFENTRKHTRENYKENVTKIITRVIHVGNKCHLDLMHYFHFV